MIDDIDQGQDTGHRFPAPRRQWDRKGGSDNHQPRTEKTRKTEDFRFRELRDGH